MFWFTLIMFVVSFALSFILAPDPNVENARAKKFNEAQFPQITAGAPIPWFFGRVFLKGPNVGWYGDFDTRPIKKKIVKKLRRDSEQIIGYEYYIGLQLIVGLGPGVRLRAVWSGQQQLRTGQVPLSTGTEVINLPGLYGGREKGGGFVSTMDFYSGEITQAQNAYLATQTGATTPGYVGLSHIVFQRAYVGTTPQLRPLKIEADRYPDELGLVAAIGSQRVGDDDINPMEVLYNCLTYDWGGIGLDASEVDVSTMRTVANVLLSEGNGMSIALQSPTQAKSFISEVLRHVDGILYQEPETGQITIKLIRDDYTPAALPLFDETNCSVESFSRTAWSETINEIRVTYTHRLRNYEPSTAFAQDMANINFQGRVRSATINMPGTTESDLAGVQAARELGQRSVPLFNVKLKTDRSGAALRPGSPFRFSWSDYNISEVVMRVSRFDLGTLLDGEIGMQCLQDTFASSNALFTTQGSAWAPIDRDAADITEFKFFESPMFFVGEMFEEDFRPFDPYDRTQTGIANLWALPVRPDSDQQRYDAVVSDDDFDADIVFEVTQQPYPNQATLETAISKTFGMPDGDIDTLTIENLFPDTDFLNTTTAAGIREGNNLILVDDEIMGFLSFTDNGSTIDLNDVYRALLDTEFADHAVGAQVFFLTDTNFLSQNSRDDSTDVKVKFLSHSDQEAQDIDDVSSSSYTMTERLSRPAPPDYTRATTVRAPQEIINTTSIAVDWRERNRTDDSISLVADSADTPEGTETYNATLTIDGTVIEAKTGLGTASTTFNTGVIGRGNSTIQVWSVRDGYTSHTPDTIYFYYDNFVSISSELLTNGDFESSFPGADWTVDSGSWLRTATGHPLEDFRSNELPSGTRHLESTGTTNQATQDFTLTASEFDRQGVIRFYQASPTAGATGQCTVELLDGGASVLESTTTDLHAVTTANTWELHEIFMPILSTAVTLRVKLIAPAAGAAFDALSFKVVTTGVSTTLRYDSLGSVTSVEGAWGLRQLVSTYSGAIARFRDTSDDSEFDVGFDADGNLEGWYSRLEPRIVKLYDQSGNGNDLEVVGNFDPRFRHTDSETGRGALNCDVGDQVMRDEGAVSTSKDYMIARPNTVLVCGAKRTDVSLSYCFYIPDDEPQASPFWRWGLLQSTTTWRYVINGSLDAGDTWTQAPTNGKNVVFMDAQNGDIYHNDDSAAADTFTAADVTYPNASRLTLFGRNTAGTANNWDIDSFHELVIFDGTLNATDRATIFAQTSDYWFNENYDLP